MPRVTLWDKNKQVQLWSISLMVKYKVAYEKDWSKQVDSKVWSQRSKQHSIRRIEQRPKLFYQVRQVWIGENTLADQKEIFSTPQCKE